MKARTGGIWQEIGKVSDELDDFKDDVYPSLSKLETHLQAMDKRITEYFEKTAPKKKPVTKKSKS